jgi:hypothetical protein
MDTPLVPSEKLFAHGKRKNAKKPYKFFRKWRLWTIDGDANVINIFPFSV